MAYIQGVLGEFNMKIWLLGLNRRDYTIFNDVYIPKADGTTSQIDHLIISRYGIFVLETKNYSGWIMGRESDSQWVQVLYQTKNKFLNPLIQNKGHVKYLAQYLAVNDLSIFKPAVVFTMKAELKKIEATSPVLYSIQVNGYIKRQQEIILTEIRVEEYIQKIKQLGKADYTVKHAHVEAIQEKQKQIKAKCPRCGKELVKRKAKSGSEFIGCTGFPKCRFTKSVE